MKWKYVHISYFILKDLVHVFFYWKKAAAQGYSAAQVKLGNYYYYGLGTKVDYETAAALYRKASDQQYNAQAMFNLGYMHEQGLGMKRDWHLAKRFYDLAAETNADAKVLVAIELIKLQVLDKIEAIKESPYKFIFYLDENIAANWELYMITILTLLEQLMWLHLIAYRNPSIQEQQPDIKSTNTAMPTTTSQSAADFTTRSNTQPVSAAAARSSTADPLE